MMIKQKISLTILMGIAVTLTIGTVSSSISYIFAADEDDNNDNKEQIQEELEEQDEKSHKLEAKEWNQKNKLVEPEQKMIIPVANAQQKSAVGSPAPDQQQLVKQLEAEKQKLIQELEQRKQQQQIQEQILNQNEMKLILGEVTIPIDANTHLNLDLPKSKIVVEPSAVTTAPATQTTSTSAGVAK